MQYFLELFCCCCFLPTHMHYYFVVNSSSSFMFFIRFRRPAWKMEKKFFSQTLIRPKISLYFLWDAFRRGTKNGLSNDYLCVYLYRDFAPCHGLHTEELPLDSCGGAGGGVGTHRSTHTSTTHDLKGDCGNPLPPPPKKKKHTNNPLT